MEVELDAVAALSFVPISDSRAAVLVFSKGLSAAGPVGVPTSDACALDPFNGRARVAWSLNGKMAES